MIRSMCPHCGKLFEWTSELIPFHYGDKPMGPACHGVGQIPRNPESDARPLWNGERNPHFKG